MLISLEGIDGSGKTTVAESLSESYPEAIHTAEPTDSWYGDIVDRSITDPNADPVAELFLYTADHAAHLQRVIRPALARGNLVISDRYADSRYAYQGAALTEYIDQPMEYIQAVHKPWSRPPDATLYFDVDPVEGAERSGRTNKFEQVSFLQKVHTNYQKLVDAEPDRFIEINANTDLQTVISVAEDAVQQVLTRNKNS